tara:strand:+ start:1159 stop:1308 length:150 start_codon:yes stop_codon:yes gene_type:complete
MALSSEFFAKQCLPLVDKEYSLLQQMMLRTLSLEMADPIVFFVMKIIVF